MRSHLRRRKSKRVKRQFKKDLKVDPSDVKRIERLLGKRFRRG
jgi:ribosomal protein L35